MKRVLAISILFVFLIAYITPITSVKATEVVWGDNNSYYLTDEEFYTARQLATLEIIPQLTGNGVNELSINNAESIDDWIINFLEFVDSNAESAVSDIYSTCVELKNDIDNTANRIGQELKEFGTDLSNGFGEISDWFDTLIGVKTTYLTNPSYIRDFNRLSRISTPEPEPEPDPNYLTYIRKINTLQPYGNLFINLPDIYYWGSTSLKLKINPLEHSYLSYYNGNYSNIGYSNNGYGFVEVCASTNVLDLNINDTGNGNYIGIINGITKTPIYYKESAPSDNYYWFTDVDGTSNTDYQLTITAGRKRTSLNNGTYTYSGTLEQVLSYYSNRVRNVNIYVNGNPWSIVYDNNANSSINININGIDFYGEKDKQPIQYYYPQGTQIDYKKLYLVIKQAIEDSLPISQTTINNGDVYYDNSNNVYAPVIYNYYSDDETESDVISDVLTLAVIPKFDTALLDPIEEPITNGTVIMFTGVQALPSDILFVIGAGFVLILFGAFINRLIE